MTEYIKITPDDNFEDKIANNQHILGTLYTQYELSSFKISVKEYNHTLYLFPDTTVIEVNNLENGVLVQWVNKKDFEETGHLSILGLIFNQNILKPDFKEIDEQSQEDIKRIIEGPIVDFYQSTINLKSKYTPEYSIYGKEINDMKTKDITDYTEYLIISKVSDNKYQTVAYWIMKHKSGVVSRLHNKLYINQAQYDLIKEKIKM